MKILCINLQCLLFLRTEYRVYEIIHAIEWLRRHDGWRATSIVESYVDHQLEIKKYSL